MSAAKRKPRHGTLSEYVNHKCRCERCRAALRDHQARYRYHHPERDPVSGRLWAEVRGPGGEV